MKRSERRLPKEEIDQMLYVLCLAVAEMRRPEEASALLRDLLSYEEAEMLARRLRIAELLEKGKTYADIVATLHTGPPTIARVHAWLKTAGEGFRLALRRTHQARAQKRPVRPPVEPDSWRALKRRYPAYYWPELLLEEIVLGANRKQRERIRSVLHTLERSKEKPALYRKLRRLLTTRRPPQTA